jgi:hypothetical protein
MGYFAKIHVGQAAPQCVVTGFVSEQNSGARLGKAPKYRRDNGIVVIFSTTRHQKPIAWMRRPG